MSIIILFIMSRELIINNFVKCRSNNMKREKKREISENQVIQFLRFQSKLMTFLKYK